MQRNAGGGQNRSSDPALGRHLADGRRLAPLAAVENESALLAKSSPSPRLVVAAQCSDSASAPRLSARQYVTRATEISDLARISFWDALIVASAEEVDADELLSEDLNEGQVIAGIKVVNPLKAGPEISRTSDRTI